jgi:hypothetical protein
VNDDGVLSQAEIASAAYFPDQLADRTAVSVDEFAEACEQS